MVKIFTSDLHDLHKNIVSLTDRKRVVTQEHHSEWLVELINKQVTNNDQLYILGDCSFATKYEKVKEFFSKLNGQIFIIKGNHDRTEILNQLVKDKVIMQWYDYKEIEINKTKVVMFHYPVASWNKQHYGSFCLHGHCHGSYSAPGKILDVGLDSAYNIYGEHRLFSEQDIEQYMFKRLVSTVDHHKEPTVD
jgi:calcineurin-like phosphoesterase family protein